MTDRRMAINKPVLWFSTIFLDKPPLGWEVDWDHIDATTPLKLNDDEAWCACEYMAGILIKHVASHRVWRLTGVVRGKHPSEMLEGKWPD